MPLNLCAEGGRDILERHICLSALSKNLKGELRPLQHERERCAKLRCVTLKTIHFVQLNVGSNKPCDSQTAQPLDGALSIRNLVTAFEGGDGTRAASTRATSSGGARRWSRSGRSPGSRTPAPTASQSSSPVKGLHGGPILRDGPQGRAAAARRLPSDRDVPLPLRSNKGRGSKGGDRRNARGRDRLRIPKLIRPTPTAATGSKRVRGLSYSVPKRTTVTTESSAACRLAPATI